MCDSFEPSFVRRGVRVAGVGVVVVLFAVVATGALTGTAAAQTAPDCSTVTYPGAGTDANPYEVGNVDQLQCIEEQGLDANYTQVSDIDASETSDWNTGEGFDPIGFFNSIGEDDPFDGKFDGQGYEITDLTINRASESDVGLFGANRGDITEVSLVSADITGSGDVGGLVGDNPGAVSGSYVTGSVDGEEDVGGLVGLITVEAAVFKSYATASVNGDEDVGGLVGGNAFGTDMTVIDSYATGSVTGTEDVGGLVGDASGTVSGSYATGPVNGDNRVGGLVGLISDATITESYATGSVDGDNRVGGLVGLISTGGGTVSDSYWDEEKTGQTTSDGGTGLNTSEMTGSAAPGNMTGFDFTNTWETVTDPDDYPILAWELEPTASFTVSPTTPRVNQTATFDGSGSDVLEGTIQTYEWDFDGDGTTDETTTTPTTTHTYSTPVTFDASLTVISDGGDTDTATVRVDVQPESLFSDPLPGFNNPPTNTGEVDPTLYEDVDGDGDGTDPSQTVNLWSELVVNPGGFDDLTQEQIDALDWNGDGQLTPADAVSLWTEQVLAQ